MIGEISKKCPQTFQLLLKVTDPFDPLWNDWNFLSFFVNAGMEITISKKSYTLKHKGTVFNGKVDKDPLKHLVKAGFKILEDYIIRNLKEDYVSIH